ncbi:MAG: class I SAM-dependent methyltransferase [Chloroflexota bacterium]
MHQVKGTIGYSEATERFIEATRAIDFIKLHQPFIDFMPPKPGRVLDVGAGIGRDASVLAEMGHRVVAVEPTAAFRAAGQRLYSPNIEWVNDVLPRLSVLGDRPNQFDFVLASAVWHHLDDEEQQAAMLRLSNLLRPKGVFVLSLRHGPAGVGTHVFPTDGQQTINYAEACGLILQLHLPNQPSLMKGKEAVTWTRLAFAKP